MNDVLEKIRLLTEPLLEGTDMFITHIRIKPINNIKLYLDADSGLSVAKSADVNRRLCKLIEAEQLFPDGDFSLEVSSPGVDEPLVQHRQYKKNIGRTVLITPVEGPDKLGVLKDITENGIVLEIKVSKKKETTMVEVPFSEIKKIVVQIIF